MHTALKSGFEDSSRKVADDMNSRTATLILGAVLVSPWLSILAQKSGWTAETDAPPGSLCVTSEGSRPAFSGNRKDDGIAPDPSTALHLRIVFARSAEQQAALDRFESELLDRRSANYSKWLTPEEFGKRYGPGDADVEMVVAWLESQGFKVNPVPPGRVDLSFSGSLHQVEQAFHTSIHTYHAYGQEFFAPVTEPVIPAPLNGTIAGVAGLITLRASAEQVAGPILTHDPGSNRWESAATQNTIIGPVPTNGTNYLALTPADSATIYNAPNPALNSNATSGPVYTGKGVTIGVVSDAAVQPSTVAKYRARFLGDNAVPAITKLDGVSDTSGGDRGYVDGELAGALAPGASIHFYIAPDLFAAIERALSDNSVDILNVGFNAGANAYGTAEDRLVQGLWAQAAAQGIAVTVPAGTGSSGCHKSGSETNLFATTAYNIAVGGTDTQSLAGGFSEYVDGSNQPGKFYGSAKSYIPESAWSDAAFASHELSAGRESIDTAIADAGSTGMGGGGNCAGAETCVSAAKPEWQQGKGVPADNVRHVPDVSVLAGHGVYGSSWAVCADKEASESAAPDCELQADGRFSVHTFGGTATAASAFAGILALVQEKTGGRLGQAGKELYGLYNGPNSAQIFHQIASANSPLPGDRSDASAGYDRVTGLGSVDAAELVKYWGQAVGTEAATVTVTPSVMTINSVTGFTVGVTVTGTLGTPTGTVVLQSGSFNSGTQTLSAGTFTFHIAPGALAVGNDSLTVSYSGDSNYATATGTATVSVTQTSPTVTATPSTHTLNSNATLNVVATVTGAGGVAPTGAVTLSGGGYTSTAQTLTSGTFTFAVPAFSLAAGADVLTVSYSGDSLYASASGSTTVSVTKSAFTLAATDITVTAGATANNASHVTVTPTGSYTGTVTLTAAVTGAPANAISAPSFTGDSVTITSGPATGFVTVTTTPVPAVRRGPLAQANGWFQAAGTMTIATMFLWLWPAKRRKLRTGLSALFLCVSAAFLVIGCGSDSKKTPTVTVKPAQASIKVSDALSVGITVAGTGSAAPSGTVMLTTGSFSVSGNLSGGSATLSIPANTLAAGQSNTLAVSYSGDKHYLTASGSATVSVVAPGTTPGIYAVTVTGTGNDAGHTSATATFSLTVK